MEAGLNAPMLPSRLGVHRQTILGLPEPSMLPSKRKVCLSPKAPAAKRSSPMNRVRQRRRVKNMNETTGGGIVMAPASVVCMFLKLPSSSLERRMRAMLAAASNRIAAGIHQRIRLMLDWRVARSVRFWLMPAVSLEFIHYSLVTDGSAEYTTLRW